MNVTFLLWLVLVAIRRLSMIRPRRISKGVVLDEGFGEDWIGIAVRSSRFELRRRLFDETHDAQVDAITPRRRRFFIGFVDIAIAVADVVAVFVCVLRWFWAKGADIEWDEIFDVEVFRRAYPAAEICSTDDFWDERRRTPQHRNGKERIVDEENEVGVCGYDGDKTFSLFLSNIGRIVVANTSDDDDDLVIEMTGGGGLLVTLVIDFYVNDDDDDDNDNDKEPKVGIHARNNESGVACCWRAIHMRTGVFLSLSYSLSLFLSFSLAVSVAVTACCWWWCEKERVTTMLLVVVAPNATP